jgi:hypothetical protein
MTAESVSSSRLLTRRQVRWLSPLELKLQHPRPSSAATLSQDRDLVDSQGGICVVNGHGAELTEDVSP